MNGDDRGGAGFTADAGDGLLVARGDPERRRAAVREAFASLLQIRRLMNAGLSDPLSAPADWERTRMVSAVALSLEAAGVPPAAVDAQGDCAVTGYTVTGTERPLTVWVEWTGPRGSGAGYQAQRELRCCADVLEGLGWVALEVRTPRGRRLDVEAPWRGGR